MKSNRRTIRLCLAHGLLLLLLGAPCLLLPAPLEAATLPPPPPANFRRFDERDGLSHPAVYGIDQDSFGFLWLATLEGLDRFDGLEMRPFRPDLAANGVVCGGPKSAVFVDSHDRVWLGSIGRGVCRYDTRTGMWQALLTGSASPDGSAAPDGIPSGASPLPSGRAVIVHDFLEDEDGTIYVATNGGVARIAPDSDDVSMLRHDVADPNSLIDDDVYTLARDPQGALWIGTRGGVSRYDAATGQFTHYLHDPDDPNSLSSNRVFAVLVDRTGRVWIGTWDGGLNELDPATGRVRTYRYAEDDPTALSSDQIMSLLEDSTGRLWVGTYGGGLNLLDRTSGRFVHYRADAAAANSLSHNNIVSLFEDKAGLLWVGTEGGGVNALNLFPLPFTVYSRTAGSAATIPPGLVLALAEDATGGLLLGTNAGGVSRLDRATGEFTYFAADPAVPGSLASSVVGGMLVDSQGVLWVGTSKGLNRYDAATGAFTLYAHDPDDPSSLDDNSVYQIVEDPDGSYWIGTYGGLNHFDPQTGRFTRLGSDPADPTTLSANLVRVLLLGEDDDLWIGTQNGGLNRFDRATGRITRYVSNPADPGSLGSGGITGLALDGEGMLWVATDDAGLHRLNPQTGAIQRFGVAEGLLDPRLMALVYVADPAGAGQGALWMSTGSGLARFDLATATFRNYDSSDGLPTGDFVPYAVYQSAQGELFFGGIDGFTAFMPQDIQGSRLQPMGQVSELYVNNVPATIGPQGLLADAVFATGAISLPAGSQSVTFLFAAPGYADARSVRFRFQLEGYNEDWVRAQPTQRGATYTNLDPGNYRFRLQAAGRDGIWGEPGRTLDVLLQPAWWQLWFVQPLAALAAAVLLGSIIVSVFQTRLRLTRRRNELLEQEVAARTTELSALLAVSQSITSEHDFDPLLVRVLDYVRDAIPHAGGILLLQNGSDAAVQSYRVASGAAVAKAGLPAAVFAVLTQVIGGGRSFAAGDLNGSGEALKPLIDLAQEDARATNWVGAPLLEQGRVVGSLLLYDVKPRHFSPDELPKLQRFANQLAIALENARLQAQAQQLAVDVERGRLSRELHDSVTQLLHSISLHANAAERALALGRPAHGAENMRQAQQLAQEAIHELRTLIFELRLTPLEEGGLVAALRAYLDTVVARSGVAVYLQAETQQRWTEDIEFELYRIAQEALTNVVKHAHASSVTVRLASTCAPDAAPCVTLEVADDGVGFDVAAAQDGRTLGLQSMAERAQKIGATLQVKSLGGRGTKVKVVLGHDKHKS